MAKPELLEGEPPEGAKRAAKALRHSSQEELIHPSLQVAYQPEQAAPSVPIPAAFRPPDPPSLHWAPTKQEAATVPARVGFPELRPPDVRRQVRLGTLRVFADGSWFARCAFAREGSLAPGVAQPPWLLRLQQFTGRNSRKKKPSPVPIMTGPRPQPKWNFSTLALL